jgi:WD40 repeat protein
VDVLTLRFSADGNTLASGSKDGTMKIWDVQAGQERTTLPLNKDDIGAVWFSLDDKILVSDKEGTITFWDVATGQQRDTLKDFPFKGRLRALSPDGRLLALDTDGGRDMHDTIKLWDRQSGKERAALEVPKDPGRHAEMTSFHSVSFSPDGKTLACILDETVFERGGPKTRFGPNEGEDIFGGVHNMDKILLWDTKTGKNRGVGKASRNFSALAFSPDGKTLAAGCADGTIKLFDAQTGDERATLKGHTKSVRDLVFCPNGKILASRDGDGTIKLWYSDTEADQDVR